LTDKGILDLGRENLFDDKHLPRAHQEVAVNRTGLVEAVAAETGLDRKQAEAAVKAFADVVIAETKSGEKVSVFGFGTFSPRSHAARMGRNPQTNTPVKIAASKGVRFAPASAFKEALNSKKAAAKKTTAKKTTAAKSTAKAPAKKTTVAKSTAKAPAKKATTKAASKSAPAAKTSARRATAKTVAPAAKAKRASAAAKIVGATSRRTSRS
jgi:DNA-binding protein HU-beta